jgi:MFS family permease
MVAALVWGAGNGCGMTAMQALVADVLPNAQNQARDMNLFMSSSFISQVLAPYVCGGALDWFASPAMAYLAIWGCTALAYVLAVPFALAVPLAGDALAKAGGAGTAAGGGAQCCDRLVFARRQDARVATVEGGAEPAAAAALSPTRTLSGDSSTSSAELPSSELRRSLAVAEVAADLAAAELAAAELAHELAAAELAHELATAEHRWAVRHSRGAVQ